MRRQQQTIPLGLLYSVSPELLAQMHVFEDVAGDEFDWEESARYDGDTIAGDIAGFLMGDGDD